MKRTTLESLACALAATTVIAISPGARAQNTSPPPPATQPAPPPAQANAQVSASGAMTLPGAAPAAAQPARPLRPEADSDHDMFVGTLAIGYLGTRTLQVGCNNPGGPECGNAAPSGVGTVGLDAPVIGVRYWLTDRFGIDGGLGFRFSGESGSNGGATVNLPSTTAFLIHGGVPIALGAAGHFTFEVIPELNLGFSSWSVSGAPGVGGLSGSGFHFDIGARAGAEIHFGFIGIPQLALQGTLGLLVSHDSISSTNNAPGGAKADYSITSFGTTLQNSPWDIFTSNVAALYYFP